MALKLDMSKAYDRVKWQFLGAIRGIMGFSERWIRLVMGCVTSVRYSITQGREVFSQMNPTKCIIQEHSLTPYLFILCVEGLSKLIQKYERNKWIHGCKVANGAPIISPMLFGDDSYLYCRVSLEEATRILKMLNSFAKVLGQKVKLKKSSVFFSKNTFQNNREVILAKPGMKVVNSHSLYLGLPSSIARNKYAIFGYFKGKIRRKIQTWDDKVIFRVSKEVLLKSVIQAISTYTMSVFLLPQQVCSNIESLTSNFWWSSTNGGKGIHWKR